MSWAKLDDRFHAHPKAISAWQREPAAVGLHAMAMSWVAANEEDGHVPVSWVSLMIPDEAMRARAVETLVDVGLWDADDHGWAIHDYLDYNPSRAELESKRKTDRQRKGVQKDSKRSPKGRKSDSSRPRDGSGTGTGTGRDRTNNNDSSGVVARANEAGFAEWLADHAIVTGRTPPGEQTKALVALAGQYVACVEEGHGLAALKLASRGAHANDWRREQGYDKADSVLRVTKVHDLIVDGQRADGGGRAESKATRRAREILGGADTIDGSAEEVAA